MAILVKIPTHSLFEALAYATAFRVYLWLRSREGDSLDDISRWWVIAAAAMGAAIGSKALYWLENPPMTLQMFGNFDFLLGGKTIVGGLIGGLFAVEWAKRRLGITTRTGDLFALPLCVGIPIGRIGCFLTGIEDQSPLAQGNRVARTRRARSVRPSSRYLHFFVGKEWGSDHRQQSRHE